MNGKLEKLTIIAYLESDFKTKHRKPFVVMMNPEEWIEESSVAYTKPAPAGSTGTVPHFERIQAPKISLKLLFDGTGVLNTQNGVVSKLAVSKLAEDKITIDENLSSTLGTVSEQITEFKKITGVFVGETHETPFLRLFWGENKFSGRISTLKFTYTLFSSDGKPLRAIVDAEFIYAIDAELDKAINNLSSPDLTHVRTVREGDTLPLMCARIYKNPKLYLEIARVNGLSNYRNLKVGSKLFFPPINNN
jgi:hypothetical protein